jgi:hypothetical protein
MELAERCRIICAERGIGQADPCPASPFGSRCYQACRRGKTYALRVASRKSTAYPPRLTESTDGWMGP